MVLYNASDCSDSLQKVGGGGDWLHGDRRMQLTMLAGDQPCFRKLQFNRALNYFQAFVLVSSRS